MVSRETDWFLSWQEAFKGRSAVHYVRGYALCKCCVHSRYLLPGERAVSGVPRNDQLFCKKNRCPVVVERVMECHEVERRQQ